MNEITETDWPGRHFKRLLLAGVLLSFLMNMCAGFLNGRALWGDEIDRIRPQSMSFKDLLRCEHIRRFATEPPLMHIVQRPFVRLIGPEAGSFFVSALMGALSLAAVGLTARRLFGSKAALIALILGVTSPLYLFYAGDLGHYASWMGSSSIAICLLILWLQDPNTFPSVRHQIGLFLAMLGLVGFHFAGLFVWLFLMPAGGLIAWYRTPRDRRISVGIRYVLLTVVPMILMAPIYWQANRVVTHLQTHNDWSRLPAGVLRGVTFIGTNLYKLAGGGYSFIGVFLLLLGAGVLWWKRREHRALLLLAIVTLIGPAVAFETQNEVRHYGISAVRFYLYAFSLVFLLTAIGATEWLNLRSRLARTAGYAVLSVLLALNLLGTYTVLTLKGRIYPYKQILAWLDTFPKGQLIVTPNQYETRWLGQYYRLPGKQFTAPCYWEEDRPRRVEGMRKIAELVPDAMYAILGAPGLNEDQVHEVRDAGIRKPREKLFHKRAIEQLVADLGVILERKYYEYTFLYSMRADIENGARQKQEAVVIPGKTLVFARFRAPPDGRMRYALVKPAGGQADLDIYAPKDVLVDLDVTLFPYGECDLFVTAGANAGVRQHVKPAPMKGMIMQSRQPFQANIAPEQLVQAGDQFVLDFSETKVTVAGLRLSEGWNAIKLSSVPDAPLLILGHQLRQRPAPETPAKTNAVPPG